MTFFALSVLLATEYSTYSSLTLENFHILRHLERLLSMLTKRGSGISKALFNVDVVQKVLVLTIRITLTIMLYKVFMNLERIFELS